MPRVEAVADYILSKTGPIPAMKLQKLVYYAQAWSLVWDEKQLFSSPIEAWANGPVVRKLYAKHRLKFEVRPGEFGGDLGTLTQKQRDTIDGVLSFYGDKSSQWLSDLTHREAPWRDARRRAGLAPGERGTEKITLGAMHDYYSSIIEG